MISQQTSQSEKDSGTGQKSSTPPSSASNEELSKEVLEIRKKSLIKSERVLLQYLPWVVLAFFVLFTLLSLAADRANDGWAKSSAWALAALLMCTALWFIICFTGAAEPRKEYAVMFAYAFTFGALALLVTPFVGSGDVPLNDPPIWPREGVLQLVRGCVRTQPSISTDAVSALTRCPDYGPAATELVNPMRSAASAASAASSTPSSDCIAALHQDREVDRQYSWLVSVGGVNVRRYEPTLEHRCGSQTKRILVPRQYVQVHGGLVVPLFVVVLAFIGAAVSLTRRIPEYQRRSNSEYKLAPKPNEPWMHDFEARESIVFQIMQLVSAPFLALATWYIVSPSTLATAVVLAFATGFLSEPLLMMIRGLAEGIRPSAIRPPATDSGSSSGGNQGNGKQSKNSEPVPLSAPAAVSAPAAMSGREEDHVDGCGVEITMATPDEALPVAQGGVKTS